MRPTSGAGKRTGRARRRAESRVGQVPAALPASCDVAVLGGGAAGLAAAISAAEAGARVVVLERDASCGRSILATGNGRCNFANAHLEPARYNDPAFVSAVCGSRWLEDVLSFFGDCGLRWCEEQGRLYPLSRQAASVRNVLLARACRANVLLATSREACDVTPDDAGGWTVSCVAPVAPRAQHARRTTGDVAPLPAGARGEQGSRASASLHARAVVVATGGSPLDALGSRGLRVSGRSPVLCSVRCEDSPLVELDGRRAHATVSLTRAGAHTASWSERGEVLFRRYGLSGIVIFNLSRRVRAGDLVELDLVPDVAADELSGIVRGVGGGTGCGTVLDGVLDPQVAALLNRLARERWWLPGREVPSPGQDAEALVALAKALPFRAAGLAETQRAQVMRGGLACGQFDPRTLACVGHPGLHACGEALDVDGDCGGFNLAWAWKSGLVAGRAASSA